MTNVYIDCNTWLVWVFNTAQDTFQRKWNVDLASETGTRYFVTKYIYNNDLIQSVLLYTADEEMCIELSGSPFPLTRQKPGVIYALNCAGPAYQDMNDIVYSSEHKQFANFSNG